MVEAHFKIKFLIKNTECNLSIFNILPMVMSVVAQPYNCSDDDMQK